MCSVTMIICRSAFRFFIFRKIHSKIIWVNFSSFYKNIIFKTLNKYKVLKKIKPYGSYANNFLSEEADIDICIVPKCNILEFSSYLEKIKDYIISKNYAEFKLRHYNNRYLLLKIIDVHSFSAAQTLQL